MKHTEPTPRSSIQGSQGARIVGGEDNQSGPGPEVMAADTLEGDRVINHKDEDLGTIKDIMIDVQRGRVAYAVMSCGGVLGMGDKLFAIPWNALTLDADRKCFVLDADEQRFEKAPGFDKDHWPSMADNQWASRVHEFYGVPPYWSDISRPI
ncbi:MAG: PRC-barrel domain-containing protein [Bacillota bacterium]